MTRVSTNSMTFSLLHSLLLSFILGLMGIVIVNVVPLPAVLSTEMLPPTKIRIEHSLVECCFVQQRKNFSCSTNQVINHKLER